MTIIIDLKTMTPQEIANPAALLRRAGVCVRCTRPEAMHGGEA